MIFQSREVGKAVRLCVYQHASDILALNIDSNPKYLPINDNSADERMAKIQYQFKESSKTIQRCLNMRNRLALATSIIPISFLAIAGSYKVFEVAAFIIVASVVASIAVISLTLGIAIYSFYKGRKFRQDCNHISLRYLARLQEIVIRKLQAKNKVWSEGQKTLFKWYIIHYAPLLSAPRITWLSSLVKDIANMEDEEIIKNQIAYMAGRKSI